MTSLPTDSFKITLTTTTTTEIIENNDITSSSIESSEPENSLDVTIPENITKSTSLYVNQDLNRSAMSLATVDYIVPSNDPRNSTQIFKLQFIDYSEFVDISQLGDSKSITANNDDYNETSESKALVDN
ncbi:994_t:CDS:1, partial [Scutellospora calospora]